MGTLSGKDVHTLKMYHATRFFNIKNYKIIYDIGLDLIPIMEILSCNIVV